MTDQPNSSNELLPCPFCGGDKVGVDKPTCDEKSAYNPSDRAFPVVRCQACLGEIGGDNWDSTSKTAIKKWNTRAPSGNASELAKRLADNQIGLDAESGKILYENLDELYDSKSPSTERVSITDAWIEAKCVHSSDCHNIMVVPVSTLKSALEAANE